MSAPLGRLRLPWVDLPLFGLLLACAPVCALPDLPEQVGLGPGGASLLERAALPQVLGLAQVQRLVTGRLGSVHVLRRVLRRPFTLFGHAQCEGLHLFGAWLLALGPLGLFEERSAPRTKADLVYEALSEEWGRRDGEISDLWADDGPSGYQPPSYEPVNPERRTPQTPSDGLI